MIRVFFENLRRALAYFWLGFHNPDYDFDSVYNYLYFKLNRIKKYFEEDEFHDMSKYMKSLNLAIKLTKNLKEDNYSLFFDKKLKEINEERGSPNESDIGIYYFKGLTEEQNKLLLDAMDKDDGRRKREEALLYEIFKKYSGQWWC